MLWIEPRVDARPDPEVTAHRPRRRFTSHYKLDILRKADACTQPGQVGALLRQEGLYSSHLVTWRQPRRAGLTPKKRGRKLTTDPRLKRVEREKVALEATTCRLERRLQRAETIIAFQKKSCRDIGDLPETVRARRDRLMQAIEDASLTMGTAPACEALGVSRASVYRQRHPARPPATRPAPPRALAPGERQVVLDTLHAERFMDQAPAQVHATLLDEGIYLCSPRTMYRILDGAQEIKERRDQVCRPQYEKPELSATQPNELWSWDITKLLGPAKWTYFYLYVILDIFSRYVVGWMVAPHESAALAERLISDTCAKQQIDPGQLTLHANRGSSMTSKPVALLLADLGVVKTHGRPHVSNDNPFSEAQFKTLKYCPSFPERFGALEDARTFGQVFFSWYNSEHHHSGLGFLTPAVVHYGLAPGVRAHRQRVLTAAYAVHPERFVNGMPQPAELPKAVWINPPAKKNTAQDAARTTIGTSGDLQVHPIPSSLMIVEAVL
jgi:putative transposase